LTEANNKHNIELSVTHSLGISSQEVQRCW